MAREVTTAYTIKPGSISKVLEAIKKAGVPGRFSHEFLAGLGLTSSNDRALVGVFKGIGFVDSNGVPTSIYREYLDGSASKIILARQLRKAYSGLFELNTQANLLSAEELKGKFASLTGQTDHVVKAMAATFTALSKEADFSASTRAEMVSDAIHKRVADSGDEAVDSPASQLGKEGARRVTLAHSINVVLPTTSDVNVYDAIFKALKEHLL